MTLKDKVIVITGGTKGFGQALAELFVKEGSNVVICSHHKDEVEKVAKEIGVLGIYADVTKEEDLITLANETLKKFGRIDIWINNAGIYRGRKNAEDFDMFQVKKMFDVNIVGFINGSRVALRHMKEKNSGVIVNILSAAALEGRPGISTYAASKWAANGFTESIREENKDNNILILAVYPGGMKTEIFGKDKSADFDKYMDPKDVAYKVINNLKKENPELKLVILRENF